RLYTQRVLQRAVLLRCEDCLDIVISPLRRMSGRTWHGSISGMIETLSHVVQFDPPVHKTCRLWGWLQTSLDRGDRNLSGNNLGGNPLMEGGCRPRSLRVDLGKCGVDDVPHLTVAEIKAGVGR